MTGDGKADIIVAAKGSPTLYVIPGGHGRPSIIDWSRGVTPNSDPITELATADFNGDGHADVAIGTPRADTHGRPKTLAGRVTLLYGTAAPPYLQTNRAVILDQDHPSLMHPGDVRERHGGRFGAALATGDFNGDRYPDLAIAAPSSPGALSGSQPHDPNAKKGALVVLYGGAAGLSTDGAQLLVPGKGGVPAGRIGDLAAADVTGDLDRDGDADLIVPASPYNGTTLAWLFTAGADGLFGHGVPLTTGSLGVPPTGWEPIETGLLDTGGDGRPELVAGVTYTVDGGERSRLVTADLPPDGPGRVTDLTARLKDLAGPGPSGEFIR